MRNYYLLGRETKLLWLAFAFLAAAALALTLAPSVRAGAWSFSPSGAQAWLLLAGWAAAAIAGHKLLDRMASGRDPYLFPIAMFLAGWGVLEIWRLAPRFGLRQGAWLLLAVAAMLVVTRGPSDLRWLRRYRYLWLIAGLALTALTLLFGVNPSGAGAQLWLGCCAGLIAGEGLYFQPSEILKLLLVVFLAAYLADKRPILISEGYMLGPLRLPPLPYILPLVMMWGFSILLLLSQRDLGTGSLFFAVFLVMLFLASGRSGYLWAGLVLLLIAGVIGYRSFDLVRLRVDAWWNPWPDASGRSFQIVQSLIAVASGGVLGRGFGLGAPGLVPVAHSDFIFAAIAEEWGLAGAFGLLAAFGVLVLRGFGIAARAGNGASALPQVGNLREGLPPTLRRGAEFKLLLAAGLSSVIALQGLMIMGGAIRLLPLTGMALPFLSYGGSALLVNFIMLGLLLKVSAMR